MNTISTNNVCYPLPLPFAARQPPSLGEHRQRRRGKDAAPAPHLDELKRADRRTTDVPAERVGVEARVGPRVGVPARLAALALGGGVLSRGEALAAFVAAGERARAAGDRVRVAGERPRAAAIFTPPAAGERPRVAGERTAATAPVAAFLALTGVS